MPKCSICRSAKLKEELFYSELKSYCSPECGAKLALKLYSKKKKQEDKAYKAETKDRKKKLDDTVPNWTKKAQKAFNSYIRERDHGLNCISCGCSTIDKQRYGGYVDCGHYRSVGSAPHLRFEPLNSAVQCKRCNSQLSGNIVEYRKGLMKRIGPEKLDWLEGPHEPKRYRVDELKAIAKHYNALARQLKQQRNEA